MEMICPSCGGEYREGFKRCASCDVDLVAPAPKGTFALAVHERHEKAPVARAHTVTFPQDCCCNCGATGVVNVVTQDTRLTRYLLFGGSEYSAQFELPFCKACEKTSKRRPQTIVDEIVSAGLLSALGLFALLFIRTGSADNLLPRSFAIAVTFGVVMTFVLYLTRRPKGAQTSYWQPIRIRKVRWADGNQIAQILLAFTSARYLSRFRDLNASLVAAGRVVAQFEKR